MYPWPTARIAPRTSIEASAASTADSALVGTGGTPESAGCLRAALPCGEMLGRLKARDDTYRQAALDVDYDLERILTTSDLVSSDNLFFAATGVTEGALL